MVTQRCSLIRLSEVELEGRLNTASPLFIAGAFNQYNDSEWHVVIAARDHNELRLDIDDYDAYQ